MTPDEWRALPHLLAEVYPDGTGQCSCDPLGQIAKPVFGLRVRCPAWEAKP